MTNPLFLFTQQEVRALATEAGFVPVNAQIAAAIAMCEAPFRANGVSYSDFAAVGDQALANSTWGFSYGGWQIRSLKAQKGTGGWRDEEKLVDPLFNAKAARFIKIDRGWSAWSTYSSGMYKAYLQDLFPPAPGTYVVVGGDTLGRIALKIGGFTWQQLALANRLTSPYTIRIGQVLQLP